MVAGSNPVMPVDAHDYMNTATRKKPKQIILAKILSIIKENPGIRPSEINRRIGRAFGQPAQYSDKEGARKKTKKRDCSLLLSFKTQSLIAVASIKQK